MGHWQTVRLGKHAGEAFQPDVLQAPGALLFLHPYDGKTLNDRPTFTQALNERGWRCLCPLAPEAWWTRQVYPPFDPQQSPLNWLQTDVLDWLAQHWEVRPPDIAVAGVEMGGQGALQLAYRHPQQFPRVAAISPKIDFQSWYGYGSSLDLLFPSAEAARQETALLAIHALHWPKRQLLLCDPQDHYCYDGVATLVSKLASTGIPYEADLSTTHGGYGWRSADAVAERVIDFLLTPAGEG